MYALAQKIAAALGPSHSFSLDVKDVSASAPVELAGIRQTLEDDITLRGDRSVPSPADVQVQVTISQTVAGFVLVAEIHRGDAQQVAVVPVGGSEELPPQPGPEPGIATKDHLAASHSAPRFRADGRGLAPHVLVFPRARATCVYEFDDGAQVLREARPISRRYSSRDLRGYIMVADATHVSAFIGGVRCDAAWNPSFSMECRENSGQQWPMGPVSWTVNPARNYFSGSITFSSSLQAKYPPFFSSASPSPATSGLSLRGE